MIVGNKKLMLLIFWIIGLILVIPTYGVSILLVLILHVFLLKKEKSKRIELFYREIIIKFYKKVSENNINISRKDEEIIKDVLRYIELIERNFRLRSITDYDKNLVPDLAVRFAVINSIFMSSIVDNKANEKVKITYVIDAINVEASQMVSYGLAYVINKELPPLSDRYMYSKKDIYSEIFK